MKDNTFIGLSISAMQNGSVKQDKKHITFIKKHIETCFWYWTVHNTWISFIMLLQLSKTK